MANVKVPVPLNTPIATPAGTPTLPWATFFRAILQGVTGPVGPQGPTGPTGATGSTGPTGVRGSEWFSGVGAPGVIAGSLNGDWYLNTSNSDIWELLAGTWTLEGNISIPGNIDGGTAGAVYGGMSPINAGGA